MPFSPFYVSISMCSQIQLLYGNPNSLMLDTYSHITCLLWITLVLHTGRIYLPISCSYFNCKPMHLHLSVMKNQSKESYNLYQSNLVVHHWSSWKSTSCFVSLSYNINIYPMFTIYANIHVLYFIYEINEWMHI